MENIYNNQNNHRNYQHEDDTTNNKMYIIPVINSGTGNGNNHDNNENFHTINMQNFNVDNNNLNNHPPTEIEINDNDFIINLEDSDHQEYSVRNSIGPGMAGNSAVSPPQSMEFPSNTANTKNNKDHFAKTIVVLSGTDAHKEEPEIVQKTDCQINILNSSRDRENLSRNCNPRQKKASNVPSTLNNENELVLFFFINPLSGIEEGKNLINMGVKKVEFTDNLHCTAHIYNMRDDVNCNSGIEVLRNELNRISLVKVIIGGGDGSILEIIEKLANHMIDLNRCIFGVLPLGRSNDLSRALGWGDKMDITSDMAKFKLIVHDLAEATSIYVDVWEMKLVCDEKDGAIIEYGIDSYTPNKQIKKCLSGKDKNITTFKKSFINYFSLGYDARVGFGYKKRKSSLRCCNFLSYFWEGMKKHCCRKTVPLKGFLDSFYAVKLQDDGEEVSNRRGLSGDKINETIIENEARKDVIFHDPNINSNILNIGNLNYEKIVLKGEPVGIVCQNINYFIGGQPDIWKKSTNNFGLEVYEPEIDKNDKKAVQLKQERDKEIFSQVFKNSEQKLNDKKLEFFTYSSTWKLGCFKVTSNDADKVYHGDGPVIMNFKETPFKNELDKYNRVYLNIDGEYYHIVKPIELRVRLLKSIPGSKLKFIQKL